MSGTQRNSTELEASSDRMRWEAECAFREREIAVSEREQLSKDAQLVLAKAEHAASRWKNPLVVAILAATVAAIGNAFVAYTNANSQRNLEAQKSEQARILEVIRTGSPDKVAANLTFLLQAGLIRDPGMRRDLGAFLKSREPGTGPSLPTAGPGDLDGDGVPDRHDADRDGDGARNAVDRCPDIAGFVSVCPKLAAP